MPFFCSSCGFPYLLGLLLRSSVPVVQSVSEDLHSPQDVMVLLDDNAPSMPYGAWLELQRQKASPHIFDNAVW